MAKGASEFAGRELECQEEPLVNVGEPLMLPGVAPFRWTRGCGRSGCVGGSVCLGGGAVAETALVASTGRGADAARTLPESSRTNAGSARGDGDLPEVEVVAAGLAGGQVVEEAEHIGLGLDHDHEDVGGQVRVVGRHLNQCRADFERSCSFSLGVSSVVSVMNRTASA